MNSAIFLPHPAKVSLYRSYRGRKERRKLAVADGAIVSYPKSGRTWLRVLLTELYKLHFGIVTDEVLGFENFRAKNPAVPRLLFTHDHFLAPRETDCSAKAYFAGKRIVLLVRDPRDVIVSFHLHTRYRGDEGRTRLKFEAPVEPGIELCDFIHHPEFGLRRAIRFLNGWQQALATLGDDALVVRYEDMRRDTGTELARIASHIGLEVEAEEIAVAVERASFRNMQKSEAEGGYGKRSNRLMPGDKRNPQSFKVRRGKVGGYADYLEPAQLAEVEKLIAAEMLPGFGYETPCADAALRPAHAWAARATSA